MAWSEDGSSYKMPKANILYPGPLPTYIQLKESIVRILPQLSDLSLIIDHLKFFGVYETIKEEDVNPELPNSDVLLGQLERKVQELTKAGKRIYADALDENCQFLVLRCHYDELPVETTGWSFTVICDRQKGYTLPDFESRSLVRPIDYHWYDSMFSSTSTINKRLVDSMNPIGKFNKILVRKLNANQDPFQKKPPAFQPISNAPVRHEVKNPQVQDGPRGYQPRREEPYQPRREEPQRNPIQASEKIPTVVETEKMKGEKSEAQKKLDAAYEVSRKQKEEALNKQREDDLRKKEEEALRKKEEEEKKTRGVCGLHNGGNQCYLNSSIQAIRHCDINDTMNSIKKILNSLPQSSLAKQLYNLMTSLDEGRKGDVKSPKGVFDALSELRGVFCE